MMLKIRVSSLKRSFKICRATFLHEVIIKVSTNFRLQPLHVLESTNSHRYLQFNIVIVPIIYNHLRYFIYYFHCCGSVLSFRSYQALKEDSKRIFPFDQNRTKIESEENRPLPIYRDLTRCNFTRGRIEEKGR